ncbi:MAG: phosphotransferase [Verrucomicrobiales bacterium]|nr:phosphotransferase [Verrucomicrobiales bacterium]
MTSEQVLSLTQSFLPDINQESLNLVVIEKGGSGRLFYRVTDADSGRSWVAMAYTRDRPDNARFASITDFLLNHGVAVPEILARKEEIGYLLVQDLGSIDLGNYAGADWETVQKPSYLQALKTVFALHQITEDSQPADLPELEFCFDADLYQWEQDYFFNHYVTKFEPKGTDSFRSDPVFSGIRDHLSDLPRSLVHRDFQSTNVMFKNGSCYLIDYQGMRFGLPEYDVASLIYDPYVNLSEEQRDELINYYFRLKQDAGHPETFEEYIKRLNTCAIQRLMQALGAYGFLGNEKGKKEFFRFIEPAKDRLRHVAASECEVINRILM